MPKQIYATEDARLKAKREATARCLIKKTAHLPDGAKGKKTLADYDADWRSVKKPRAKTMPTTRAAKAARMDNEFVPIVMKKDGFDERFMALFGKYMNYRDGEFRMKEIEDDAGRTELGECIMGAKSQIHAIVRQAAKQYEEIMEKQRKEKEEEEDEAIIQIPKKKGRKVLPESDDEEEMIIIPKKKKSKGKKKLLIVE